MPGPKDNGKKKMGYGPAREPSREPHRTPSRGPARGPMRGPARTARPPEAAPRGGERSGEREVWLPHSIRVVYEDADIIVVDKPHGLLSATMEGQGLAPSVFSEIKKHVRASGFKPGRSRASVRDGESQRSGTRVWVIHRLDREASGLMVFAKSLRAFDVIKEELRVRRVQRSYVAVVEGIVGSRVGEVGSVQSYLWEDDRGAVHSGSSPMGGGPLGRSPKKKTVGRGPLGPIGKARAARDAGKSEGGADGGGDGGQLARMAITHYRVAAHAHGRTMLELKLDTGRKHQIRVHMRDLGHVIVGDRRYEAQTDPIGRVCLHARTLAFAHPVTGVALKFESPTPGAFVGLIGSDAVEGSSGEVLQGIVEASRGKASPAANVGPGAVPRSDASANAHPRDKAVENGSDAGWDHVADWYEGLVASRGSDHHERVIYPGTLRLLEPKAGMRVLDVACGEGELCRRLAALGVDTLGVDAAPRLIAAAKRATERDGDRPGSGGREARARGAAEFQVADATRLHETKLAMATGSEGGASGNLFDAATCVMALMNIAPVEPVMAGVARWLKPGGRFVGVILHPAFRSPGQTSWQWDEVRDEDRDARDGRDGRGARPSRAPARSGRPPVAATVRQYRRVDAYLSPAQRPIVMNPGAEAKGAEAVTTLTHHRPIQVYVRALAQAGLLVDAMEEWASARRSEPGPRAAEEDRARREIPMFLAIRAVRVGG